MNLFASFLTSKWRWPAAALGVVFAVLLLTQGYDYASTWWARRSLSKHLDRTEQAHDARAATEPAARHRFDSLLFSRIGEARQLKRTLAKIKHLDDSLRNRLSAAPALPADPPRQ